MTIRRVVTSGMLAVSLTIIYISVYGTGTEASQPVIYNCPSPAEMSHQPGIGNARAMALNARSALIVDNSGGTWLYAKNAQKKRPIASLTKLLTAMVYLDTKPRLDSVIYISGRDCYKSAKSLLFKGEAYRARDLLYAALMASDNRAARALATASELPREIFIQKMNKKARSLGMMNTEVCEVTGLDQRNLSTAADLAILINESMKYPEIRKSTSKYTHTCKLQNKNRKKRFINTNRMVRSRWKVQTGKTGFILEADYCLATILKDQAGKEITIIVMGSPRNEVRFSVARKMAFYGFKKARRGEYGS